MILPCLRNPLLWGVLAALALGAPMAMAQERTARFGAADAPEILFRSTTDLAILEPILARFLARHPQWAVQYEQWGSNDLYALARDHCAGIGLEARPISDAILSSAVHQMLALVNAACAQPYQSPRTTALPPDRRWRDELWGVTEEPAVIIYNRERVTQAQVPRARFDLLDMMRDRAAFFRGRVATYDIDASGLGYLLAFADSLQASTHGALLEGFAAVNAVATCCSAEIIQGVADGTYLLGYNILGSYVGPEMLDRVGVVMPSDYTLFLSRAFIIPRTARAPEGAALLLDYLLSDEGQNLMQRQGLVANPADYGLTDSARRFVKLDLTLLVALDAQQSGDFSRAWRAIMLEGQAMTPQPE